MARVFILGLTLLLCAMAEQPEELLREPLDADEVEPTDLINLTETRQLNKISFDRELCSSTVQHNGINIFCPRKSNPFCFCEGNKCDCCFNMKLYLLNINNNLCVELSYNGIDRTMLLILRWNDFPIVSTGFPFVKPTAEPVCVGLSIIGTKACVHFSDMSIIAGQPNFCASLVISLFGKTVFLFKIGCFEYVVPLGADLRYVGFLVPADSYTRNITVLADNDGFRL